MAVPQGVPRIVVVVAAAADRLLAGEFVELLGGARVRTAPAARRESDCGHYRQADLHGSLHRVYRTAMQNNGAGTHGPLSCYVRPAAPFPRTTWSQPQGERRLHSPC